MRIDELTKRLKWEVMVASRHIKQAVKAGDYQDAADWSTARSVLTGVLRIIKEN